MKNFKSILLVEEIAKYMLRKLKSDHECDGSEDYCETERLYCNVMTKEFNYTWENDEEAGTWFEKATTDEIWEHILTVTIPKVAKGYSNIKTN